MVYWLVCNVNEDACGALMEATDLAEAQGVPANNSISSEPLPDATPP